MPYLQWYWFTMWWRQRFMLQRTSMPEDHSNDKHVQSNRLQVCNRPWFRHLKHYLNNIQSSYIKKKLNYCLITFILFYVRNYISNCNAFRCTVNVKCGTRSSDTDLFNIYKGLKKIKLILRTSLCSLFIARIWKENV